MSKVKYNADQVKSVFDANPSENSIIITSCGNVFLAKHKHYAESHCREAKSELSELTREQFNAENKGGSSKAPSIAAPSATDWKAGKFAEIIEFARSKGFEATTKQNKGTKALIAEVEAHLATLEPAKDPKNETEGGEAAEVADGSEGSDYTPVGAAEGSKGADGSAE